jgi:hypothetical protein
MVQPNEAEGNRGLRILDRFFARLGYLLFGFLVVSIVFGLLFGCHLSIDLGSPKSCLDFEVPYLLTINTCGNK